MSSNNTFFEIKTDNEIAQMKKQYRAMQKKRDNICVEIAIIQNMPNIWDMEMVNWNDPEIQHLKEPYFQIESECSKLFWEIEEAEAIRDNEYDKFVARKKVYTFLDEIGDAKSIEYLQRIGMSTLRLVDAVLNNPDFIKETYKGGVA